MVKYTMFVDGMAYHCKDVNFSQIYSSNVIPMKIPAGYFKELKKLILKYVIRINAYEYLNQFLKRTERGLPFYS